MNFWNFGVFADNAHITFCYAASVRAPSEREAFAVLRAELKHIPMELYIGALVDSTSAPAFMTPRYLQATQNSDVVLMKSGAATGDDSTVMKNWRIVCQLSNGDEREYTRLWGGMLSVEDAALLIKGEILSYDLQFLGEQRDMATVCYRLLSGLGVQFISIQPVE